MPRLPINYAAEGTLDLAVVARLISFCGGVPGNEFDGPGKPALLKKLIGFNLAARHSPWFVLADLDIVHSCVPAIVRELLPAPSDHMIFRLAVHEVEAWLLADIERIATFLRISAAAVPRQSETLEDPKQSVVNLARRSRSRQIREDIVPREGSGRKVGPAYVSRLASFARDVHEGWRPDVAARNSPSLSKAVHRLSELLS